MQKPLLLTAPRLLVAVGLIICAAWAISRAAWHGEPQPSPRQDALVAGGQATAPAPATDTPPAANPPAPAPARAGSAAAKAAPFESFHTRPFAVTKTSGANEWTAEDGRDPETIFKLAHNELEAERLLDENPRIKRRQLVYRNEPLPLLLDRARDSGQPLENFILPAMDGRELNVEVTTTRVEDSKQWGTVTGRLKDHFNSMVSVGFSNGYESFNVVSPEEGLYLIGEAREPGEVIIKEFDPDKYAPPTSDAPDFIPTSPLAARIKKQ